MSKKSILQSDKECFMCGTTYNLERHHVIFGTAYEDKHSRDEWVERIGRNYL